MMSVTSTALAPASERPALRPQLLRVAEDAVDAGHGGQRRRVDLRGAAGDDDAGAGLLAARPADRLARLALGLGGDGAGVDDDGVGQPGRGGVGRASPRFVGVEPAAEGEDLGRHAVTGAIG